MGENGRPFSACGFRSIFLIGGITRHYRPKGPERGFIMANIDKQVSNNAAARVGRFTIKQATGSKKEGTYKLVKTYHVTGLKLDESGTPTAAPENIASLKGVLGAFPHFAKSVISTYLPVYSRAKAKDGAEYTLAQLLALCAPNDSDERGPKAKAIALLLKDDPELETDDMKPKAWKKRGFNKPPTDEEIDAVKAGQDPFNGK